ncbi:molecular chaperone TorD [Budvicia diplopodorum]|uniref:molecular chaperone TorD n=1 Tax=Budvicia diplopodorum TaxID=1119056 RepID=UPI00135C51DF|nr:molecular chaperone TorD [Budvicia diplopodorum]
MSHNQDLALICQHRATIYAWFSGLFAKELDSEGIARLLSPPVNQWLTALGTEASLTASVNQFKQSLTALNLRQDAVLELSADFAGLFLMPKPVETQPYASIHTDKSSAPKFRQQACSDVQAQLASLGLKLHSAFNEPEDHLAVLLELIGHLAYASAEQPERQEALLLLQKQQIAQLLSWLPDFSQACRKHDAFGFYANLADLMVKFIQSDSHWLEQ